MKRYLFVFVALMGLLILTASTQAASIDVTLHANSIQDVTFSDGGGMYFDDWRIWGSTLGASGDAGISDGSPIIADEKAGATNIGDVTVSMATRVGSADKHLFTYTAADALDGTGATDFGSAFKLCGLGSTVSVDFSVSDIGAAGVLHVYSGGYCSGQRLDAVIGSDDVSVSRASFDGEYADWWEIQYSGVTDTQSTLDITITTTDWYHDMQFYSAALDVTQVPEPSALAMLVAGAFGLAWFGRRRVKK